MFTLLFALFTFAQISTAQAEVFPDTQGHKYEQFILELQEAGVVEGNPDGTFAPERTVNRAEFLKMIMLASGYQLIISDTENCFADFTGEEQWYWVYACSAKEYGFVDGHPDGTFRGEVTVNLAEAAKMTAEAFDITLPVYIRAPDNWYDPYLDAAAGLGLFLELPHTPDMPLTRAQSAVVIRLLDPEFVETRASSSTSYSSAPSTDSTCGNGIVETGEQCDDGNGEDGDGCSSACIVVLEPVYHGALRIEQRPLGTLTATAGAQDVLLLAFDAIAGRQDMFITQLQFAADVGSLESGTNYRLYYDTNNDGTADTVLASAVVQNEQLSFSNIEIPIKNGYSTRIEVRGNVRNSGAIGPFSLSFATAEPGYIAGVDAVDGRDVTGIETDNSICQTVSICWIAVYTQPSRLISLGATPGNLYVQKDATPVRNHQLLLGQQSPTVLRLQFTATQEAIRVKKIRIGGGNTSIDRLKLYFVGESSAFATATQTACGEVITGQYCADVNFEVLKDADKDVLVQANVRTDVVGGKSGSTAAFALSAATVGSSVAVEAEGKASLFTLQQSDGDSVEEGEIHIGRSTAGTNIAIVGPTQDLVAAKISSITNSHVDPSESTVPLGQSSFATFRFQAADHSNSMNGLNSVALEDITFTVQANNIEIAASSIEIYNPQNSSVTTSCSQSATTGVLSVTCSNLDAGVLQAYIAPSEFLDLSLRGNIINSQVTPGTSTLQASIQGLGTRNTGPIHWNDEVFSWFWIDTEQSAVRSTLYKK